MLNVEEELYTLTLAVAPAGTAVSPETGVLPSTLQICNRKFKTVKCGMLCVTHDILTRNFSRNQMH